MGDLEDCEERVYARPSHMYATVPYAFAMLAVRYLFERYISIPLAGLLGIKEKVCLPVANNPVLQNYFLNQSRAPTQADITALSKKTGWSERNVNIWFRRRRNR